MAHQPSEKSEQTVYPINPNCWPLACCIWDQGSFTNIIQKHTKVGWVQLRQCWTSSPKPAGSQVNLMSTNFLKRSPSPKFFLPGFVSGIQRLTVSSSPRASLVMKEVELFIKNNFSFSFTIDHWFQIWWILCSSPSIPMLLTCWELPSNIKG